MSQNIANISAKRTAIGNFLGGLSTLPAHQLGKTVIEALLADSGVAAADIDEVILGQVLGAGEGQNPARQASIKAGLPIETPAWGINQVCGSGLRAVALGMQSIATGTSTIVIAGGQESMSNAVHVANLRNGQKMGDASLRDSMITDGLWDAFNDYHMGITAENIAEQFNISREAQDAFAAASQQKAETAQNTGAFDEEITPVVVPNRKGDITVDTDEFPRHGTTAEGLGKLRAAFKKEGTVTAGNASGINDGAAAVLLMTEEEAKKRGLIPLAIIKSFAQSGVSPDIMGTGPITASQKALEKAGWSHEELDLIEANEAFAAQAISVNEGIGWDTNKVNVNGGAIALGHPIGASGARVLVTLLHALKKRGGGKGLATLCVGGGMGVALTVEA